MATDEAHTEDRDGGERVGVRAGSDGPGTVVWLSGEHDLASKDAVAVALAKAVALDDDADVVIDLTDASFIDASILGAMVRCHHVLAGRARRLRVRGAEGLPRRVIEICEVAELIEKTPVASNDQERAPTALESWVEVPSAPRGRAPWHRQKTFMPAKDPRGCSQ